MIDFEHEKLIGLADVPSIPWLSRKPTLQTVYRWVRPGLRDRGGVLTTLEVVQEGGRMSTSAGAVMRFFERLRGDASRTRTPSQATIARRRAEATLDAAGIK